MTAPSTRSLPRPGVVGRLARLAVGVYVLSLLRPLSGPWRGLLAGDVPVAEIGFWIALAVTAFFSSWVVNELFQRDWGLRVTAFGTAIAAAAAGVGLAFAGTPWTPLFGGVSFVWIALFVALLAPAMILAALLGTPGCEMRSFAHLRAKFAGGGVDEIACPGGIDFLDRVRVFGRW